jgi:undecaprenyl-diphosphatase
MVLIQSILFSIIQGITEFLPISSSGHLNLIQYIFRITPSLTFDIFLNTATFISVLFFFRKQVPYFFKNLKFIIVGTIPTIFVALFLKDKFDLIFSDIKFLPFLFLITSAFVFSTKFIKDRSQQLNFKRALIIGLFQAIAILPGVSRSGSTIFAGLLIGLSPLEAFNFSFSLFIPASLGAIALDYENLLNINFSDPNYIISFIIAALVGIIALSFLKNLLIKKNIWYFGIYTFVLALSLFFALY